MRQCLKNGFVIAVSLLSISSLALGAGKFKVGDKVDVEQGGQYYKAKIVKTDKCIGVLYDDGTVAGNQAKADMAPFGTHTDGEPKATSLAFTVDEKVDLKWTDSNWYKGKITSTGECFQVEYIGWNGEKEFVAPARVFAWDSKVKGSTAQSTSGGSASASSGGKKFTPDQMAKCAELVKNRNGCMRVPYCKWAYDKCSVND